VKALRETIDEYMQALQGFIGAPLGDHAVARAPGSMMPPV
jgi:hypothetical protein